MLKIEDATNQENPGASKKFISPVSDDKLHHLAFPKSLQSAFIITDNSKKILTSNKTFGKWAAIPDGELTKSNLFSNK